MTVYAGNVRMSGVPRSVVASAVLDRVVGVMVAVWQTCFQMTLN